MMTSKNNILKIFFRIVIKFFVFYFVLFLLYQWALSLSQPDPFTRATTNQTALFMQIFSPDITHKIINDKETGIFLKNQWITRIVEGCNGMNIIILFWALIWAFPARIKDKILFSLTGALLIWITNILRIAFLSWIYYRHNEWFEHAHNVVFPGMIYGMLVILWLYWAHKTAKNFQKSTKTTSALS